MDHFPENKEIQRCRLSDTYGLTILCHDETDLLNLNNYKQVCKTLFLLNNSIVTDLKQLRKLQTAEFELPTQYKLGWQTAKTVYEDRLKQVGNFSALRHGNHPPEYHIALIAYTLAHPALYQDFNFRTRNVTSSVDVADYPYKSFYRFLLLAVEHVTGSPHSLPKDILLYRGLDVDPVEAAVGRKVIFQQFCSATRSLKIAKEFGYKTIIVFQGFTDGPMCTGMDHHSICIDEEQEELLWPHEEFVITKIDKHDNSTYIYLKP